MYIIILILREYIVDIELISGCVDRFDTLLLEGVVDQKLKIQGSYIRVILEAGEHIVCNYFDLFSQGMFERVLNLCEPLNLK